jgi:hypothetical protein
MTLQEPKPRQTFQNEMPDMVHCDAPIYGPFLKPCHGRPRHLINTTPGMGKILDELAILIEGAEEMAAERPLRRPHGRKGDMIELNARQILRW